ncbi:MAG: hypothetical protein B7Z38_01450 [Rhodobacterales bacterium 12-64-8]|nr:MAG: hypothetical protein B7Z38_01450 [Rhodobacterales bacterium 12-64-8]OYX46644.1 MAG: hypothetical protein B7Y90_14970 [Alphaproteobacteria bacterium 32-64-14]
MVDIQHPRITRDPAIMTGKPCIRDTRIPVDLILRKLASGESRERLLADYARLDKADFDAALAYAAAVVAGERLLAAE